VEAGKTDRRVKYTKALLRDALVELMQKNHISGISVKALCDLADVNRSTFYNHYADQYDLLNQIEQEALDKLKRHLERQDYYDNQPISAQVLTSILEYVKENAGLFKALLSENCDFAFQKDVIILAEIISSQLSPVTDARMQEYVQEFGINSCVCIVKKWLHDGMIEPPVKISEFILQMLYHGVSSFQQENFYT